VMTASDGQPPAEQCATNQDVGRLHYNTADDIWYECFCDERHGVFTWAVIPLVDEPLG
jgi:hypothetical protein